MTATVDASARLDAKIEELAQRDQPVTLEAFGGVEAIPVEWAGSAMFPYAAEAIAAEWDTLSGDQQAHATRLICSAITGTPSALALSDTCAAVVPAAAGFGVDIAVKDALCHKASARSTRQEGALAATALRWLAHLAVNTPTANPALADLLIGVARNEQEPAMFAVAAAQVAGIAYDHWRDPHARDCLQRLTGTEADADAWFGMGQAHLVDAFQGNSRDEVMESLRAASECFERAILAGEDRPDAALYKHITRFVAELADGASAAMLQTHIDGAEKALREYMLNGSGLPEQPGWLRPRYTAENAWIVTVQRLRQAVSTSRGSHPWYKPAVVISALSEAYQAANSLILPRHKVNGPEPSTGLSDLVAPQLTAPFLDDAERLAFVDIWIAEESGPDAEAFARLVQKAAEQRIDGNAADEQVVRPKAQHPLGNTQR